MYSNLLFGRQNHRRHSRLSGLRYFLL